MDNSIISHTLCSKNDFSNLLVINQNLSNEVDKLKSKIEDLSSQLNWFKKQIFGTKSEKQSYLLEDHLATQICLGEEFKSKKNDVPELQEIAPHKRSKQQRKPQIREGELLQFDDRVPIEEIELKNPELENLPKEDYTIVSEVVSHKLAQRPGAYVVLRYTRKTAKLKLENKLITPAAPPAVFERSYADVSFLAGMVIDKFTYHLPLYRQHRRLQNSGIFIDRSSLTKIIHRIGDLLEPIYAAILCSILSSKVLQMDEVPIKAGRKKNGKMQTSYFWPVHGDKGEIVFPYSSSRSHATVREVLGDYKNILLSDGYEAYSSYAASIEELTHAACWVHTRRNFVNALEQEPQLSNRAIELIAKLYEVEKEIRDNDFSQLKILKVRGDKSKAIVNEFFLWLKKLQSELALLPSNKFTKAMSYALKRERELRVFLEYPYVPMDTNMVENKIRPVTLGRKNWLFCSTEIGAKYVGIFYSILATCKLQDIDAYTYLVDILQRIESHPVSEISFLTPRIWKNHFADNPLRSDIDK